MKKLILLIDLLLGVSVAYAAPVKYIQSRETLQAGTTIYVSSGTIAGPFKATSVDSTNGYAENGLTVLYSVISGSKTTVGVNTGSNIGTRSTAVGTGALYNNGGNDNTAIGSNALASVIGGLSNTAVGASALKYAGGRWNTAVGDSALSDVSAPNGERNTAVGYAAIFQADGNDNTALGYFSGQTITTGTNNLFLGSSSNASIGTLNNAIAIGANAVVSSSNTMQLGGTGANAVVVTMSSATMTSGYFQLASKTSAQIKALTPSGVGQEYYCSDCSSVSVCISTGTALGAWSLITAKTSECQ